MSRKNLVDGSVAYKDRKFEDAEALFRKAAARDPEGKTDEGKTAQIFLARTLHSMYIGNRKNTALAEEAISEYKKALALNKNDQSSYKAVASLLENLQKPDEWQKWVTDRANDTSIEPADRSEALISLAAKQNTCASEVTDTPETKKTVKDKDGKDIYQFVKPADPAAYDKLKACVEQGMKLVDEAAKLEPPEVKNANADNLQSLSDQQLKEKLDAIKPFESARSYRASIIIQSSRLAEMDGRTEDRDRLKAEGEAAKEDFVTLSKVVKAMQDEIDRRTAVKQEETNKAKASNTAAK